MIDPKTLERDYTYFVTYKELKTWVHFILTYPKKGKLFW